MFPGGPSPTNLANSVSGKPNLNSFVGLLHQIRLPGAVRSMFIEIQANTGESLQYDSIWHAAVQDILQRPTPPEEELELSVQEASTTGFRSKVDTTVCRLWPTAILAVGAQKTLRDVADLNHVVPGSGKMSAVIRHRGVDAQVAYCKKGNGRHVALLIISAGRGRERCRRESVGAHAVPMPTTN